MLVSRKSILNKLFKYRNYKFGSNVGYTDRQDLLHKNDQAIKLMNKNIFH